MRRRSLEKGDAVRTIFVSSALIVALATGANVEPAQAKGCIKGAIVGGIAGHAAGHGVLGAVGGCVTGRALANRAARQKALREQQQQEQSRTDPQTGLTYTPSSIYTGGAYTRGQSGVDSQGSMPGSAQAPSYASPGAVQGQYNNQRATMPAQGY